MKTHLLLLLIMSLAGATLLQAQGITRARITSLVSECRVYDGVDVVQIGRVGTALLKATLRTVAVEDEDAAQALRLMRGVKGISVIDFEDCPQKVRSKITDKLDRLFKGEEPILEAKDSDERLYIYGSVDSQSGEISDFVLYSPSECSLICIFGTVNPEVVAQYIK